jgi:SH3 domain-containing protein
VSIRSSLTISLRLAGIGAAATLSLLAVPVSASSAPTPSAHHVTVMPSATVQPVLTTSASTVTPAVNCTVQSIGSGVNVRRQPTTRSASLGQLQRGQRVTSPGCTVVINGQSVSACGNPANTAWWEVNFAGTHGFVTADCVVEV